MIKLDQILTNGWKRREPLSRTTKLAVKMFAKSLCVDLNISIIKKTAVILDFCLFGNIHHNFVVPRIIESAPKTFTPIQIPDLHRVKCRDLF